MSEGNEEVELLRELVAQNEAEREGRRRRRRATVWVAVVLVALVLVAVPVVVAAQNRAAAQADYDRRVCEMTEMLLGASEVDAAALCRD